MFGEDTLLLGTDFTADGLFHHIDASTNESVTISVMLQDTETANNYFISDSNLLTGQPIQKAEATGVNQTFNVVNRLAYSHSFNLDTLLPALESGKSFGEIHYSITSVENTDGVLSDEPSGTVTSPLMLHVANIAQSGKTATLTITVSSGNYQDFTATLTVQTVDRAAVDISGIVMSGGVYNGRTFAYTGAPAFTLTEDGSPISIAELDILYTSTDDGGYSSNQAPVNHGSYVLTLTVPDSNQDYTGNASYNFTITKCPVTVLVEHKTMTAGEAIPLLAYTVSGQLSGENALISTPKLYTTAQPNTVGSYPIIADMTGVAYSANYMAASPAAIDGTLTCEEPEAGTISINSARFDKYTIAAGHQDISVSVTSVNPLLALKNGDSTLVRETDYTVSGNTYSIKKEYLSTLPTGYTSITFDFAYGADPILAVTISDSKPANIGGILILPPYNASVSDGGSVPMTVNTGNGSASLNLGSLSERLADGRNTVVTVPPISGINKYTVSLPPVSLSGSGTGSLTLSTGVGSVTIPDDMLSGTGLTGKANITIGSADTSNLPENVKAAIGQRPLISLALIIDGKPVDWSNPDALVTVSIPYTPTAEELRNPESIVIWYIDGSGKVVAIPNGRYDAKSKTVTFSTTHFSDFAVAYNPISFNDVAAEAWYNKAVSFLAAREITNGTGDNNFSPNAKLTRGEFIVMLMRAYGIAPDLSSGENFADAGNTYYTSYLAVAKRLGLSNGVGNNRYAPEVEITRQEMFTLLYNILRSTNQLPQGKSSKTTSDFTDAGQIDVWARDALTLLVETGVVHGSNGALIPLNTTTRAEMTQVLYNVLGK